ncbi:Probable cytochrome P450 49a1 [Gryllus bimaculatus]|nr:Probable cytochrome P450 49a1 [Gryllus bimaculatus]
MAVRSRARALLEAPLRALASGAVSPALWEADAAPAPAHAPAFAPSAEEAAARPYSEVPGPRQLPLLGNAWRFLPLVAYLFLECNSLRERAGAAGHYSIEKLDEVMWQLHRDYGPVVKVGGLVGHADLLFVFDGDAIERVFRREEALPHRPSMPSLHHYKQVLRKDFFGDVPGVIGIHGRRWDEFRAQIQHIMLQPSTARAYIEPLDAIATEFVDRLHRIRDENNEMPGDFMGELYRWTLESQPAVFVVKTGIRALAEDAAPRRMIHAIQQFFGHVAHVELRLPVWRVLSTRAWRNYIGALDTFRELCMTLCEEAMERVRAEGAAQRPESEMPVVERVLRRTGDPKVAAVMAFDMLLVGIDTVRHPLPCTRPDCSIASSRLLVPLPCTRPGCPIASSRFLAPLPCTRPGCPIASSKLLAPLPCTQPGCPITSSRLLAPLPCTRPDSPIASSRLLAPLPCTLPDCSIASFWLLAPLPCTRPDSPIASSRLHAPLPCTRHDCPIASSRLLAPLLSTRPDCPIASSRLLAPAALHAARLSHRLFQTSVAAASTLYQLARNPDKQQRLAREVAAVLPDAAAPLDANALAQLPYLKACIKETLRRVPHPPPKPLPSLHARPFAAIGTVGFTTGIKTTGGILFY